MADLEENDLNNDSDVDLTNTKTDDEKFLDLIRERPCIYQKDSLNHIDKLTKENAFEDIAVIINEPVEHVEKRWQKFHRSYLIEKNKQEQESRSGSGRSRRTVWPYYDTIKSFYTKSSSRETTSNISCGKEKASCSQQKIAKYPAYNTKSYKRKPDPNAQAINAFRNTINDTLQELKSRKLTKQESKKENLIFNDKSNSSEFFFSKFVNARLDELNKKSSKVKRIKISKAITDSISDIEEDSSD